MKASVQEKLCDALVNLLKVKSIITLAIMFVFCYLALKSYVTAENFLPVLTMVVTYYFTKREDSKNEIAEATIEKLNEKNNLQTK